ncbi:proline-tRNA ligase [Pneumocystis murina B123]|uniref:Probable proline--tRNA ligase, mitochondrial n=1 Tax=Pneumocystis murina (strain B123) TaxID=1069680 RepID=M7NLH3_PNEMU|nr:proline-tRNA ligase [Pneumocystis murina B123]EMR09513.1 proline-tRNA ligase [Pneumocystis murina B123]
MKDIFFSRLIFLKKIKMLIKISYHNRNSIRNPSRYHSFPSYLFFNSCILFFSHKRFNFISTHSRPCLSNIFIPHGISCQNSQKIDKSGHDLLIKAGFLRQSSSGIYTILPLALRVQEKIENIIDTSLYKINASKISLPNLSTSYLWKKSRRWDLLGNELFRLKNRRGTEYCLSPTHEEEITNLIATEISSWRQLPLKLYQTGKKFRDEIRPRRGLLRGYEFIMNDLYTFDKSKEDALQTYKLICDTYKEIFSKLELPIVMAEANNGNIGGDLSHEFHIIFSCGEDTLIICKSCGYISNEEFTHVKLKFQIPFKLENCNCFYIKDINDIIIGIAYVPIDREINLLLVNKMMKSINSEIFTITPNTDVKRGTKNHYKNEIIHILDENFNPNSFTYPNHLKCFRNRLITASIIKSRKKDLCYKCSKPLISQKSIELAHTFYLGTKYSSALSATFTSEKDNNILPIEMGCYGIGISRILSSIAEINKDDKGLIWPITIAPWKAVIISTSDLDHMLYKVYDMIFCYFEKDSIIIDDRKNKGFIWKMKDSDLIGFPYTIIIGRHWKETGELEIQIRKTGEKIFVKPENIKNII